MLWKSRHFSGIYTIKASMHRFLKSGNTTSMPGQEGIPAVYSPMTRTLEDLEMFWKAVVSMKPWEYDHSVRSRHCHLPRGEKREADPDVTFSVPSYPMA